ncbi:pilus assembly protein [Dyella sp. 20L07]|uniref:pilus assembly protein n=1 Tax=Dyella sp. 20L07 TaxID=3384240 RepID=UPI003D26CF66
MPDICYLSGVICSLNKGSYYNVTSTVNEALINSAVNGVYYNPTIKYDPPATANGGSWPSGGTLIKAVLNGFDAASTKVDLTQYDGSGEKKFQNGGVGNGSNITFSKSTTGTKQVTTTKHASTSNQTSKQCDTAYAAANGASNQKWTPNKTGSQGTCEYDYLVTSNQNVTYNFFQYATGSANTVRYVADTDCGGLANCVLANDTSGVSAPKDVEVGSNIANWFAYYHTRILMAKSGLMNAFVEIDPKYRVGFASIDGGKNSNYTNLPNKTGSRYQYTDSYNGVQNYIAQVQPFGDGSDQTDHKSQFWTWVAKASASGGTPLRQALNAVGTYYMQPQPWSTMSTDPDPSYKSELACRQSYTILTTDGFWNEDFSSVGNVDGTDGISAIPHPTPGSQDYIYKAVAPYADNTSDTLADVAMKYWLTDLRPNTDNSVPVSTEDPAYWQHMTTFTLGMGFMPTGIKPDGTTVEQIATWASSGKAPSWAKSFSWPTPAKDSINNIADLAHAAINGHGTFSSASSPEAFSNALKEALKRATKRVGTGASLAANSTQLQTGTVAYQANYYTASWKGDLKSLKIDSSNGSISTTPTWLASSVLPAADSRKIFSYNPTTSTYMEFKVASGTPPSLSTAQLTALGKDAAAQADMVNYLRGDSSKEIGNTGGTFRSRDTAIGDIVNSQPVYVGAPSANEFYNQNFTGSTDFAKYASDKAKRVGLIYVAANDGMLHAFNAETGVEAYAYLPGAVVAGGSTNGIADLASKDYGSDTVPHQFFNDGELTVADVYMAKGWKTVLVGTTGRGLAKVVYALDVTDPANIKFLWERSAGDGNTDGGGAYIGQMTGKPVIAQTSDGAWSVLMGNGYNSAAGVSALLQFGLADGSLNVHATTDTTGLAAPAVWIDPINNGISTIAYAGDAAGNVWSFTINTTETNTTTGAISLKPTPNSDGVKLFTAMDSGNKAQPITAGMLVGKNPQTGDVWLFFGTGKYLTAADLRDASTQSWYGLIVKSGGVNKAIGDQKKLDRSSLVQRYITEETAATKTASAARTVTTTQQAASMTGLSGWFMNMSQPQLSKDGKTVTYNAQGERMVTPNQFQGSLLLATTRIPSVTDACNPSGVGWVMAVDPFTGTNPQSNFFDINGDGVVDAADGVGSGKTPAAGIGFTSLPNNPIFVGGNMLMSFDNGNTENRKTAGSGGKPNRVSWRELIN